MDSKEDEKNHRGHRDESQVTSGARSGFDYATLLLNRPDHKSETPLNIFNLGMAVTNIQS